jgi:site-specific DNA-cytosine methylase
MTINLTYLEFYSGIGGWGYALEHACRSIVEGEASTTDDDVGGRLLRLRPHLLAAYDHSDLCNSVFYHNHCPSNPPPPPSSSLSSSPSSLSSTSDNSSKRRKRNNDNDRTKPRQIPIERLTLSELEDHAADVWCMSPPCQPHTRQHANQHMESKDARSRSFLHLCMLLCDMNEGTLPKLILLENVVGFEKRGGIDDDGGGNHAGDAVGSSHHVVPIEADDAARAKTTDGQGREHEERQRTSQTLPKQQREKSCSGSGGSFDMFRSALWKRDYHVGHFQLDPTHVGIPNNRPRHYTVAFRRQRMRREEVNNETDGDAQTGYSGMESEWNRAQGGGGNVRQALPLFLEDNNGSGGTSYDHIFCRESLLSPPIIHRGWSMPPLSTLSSFLDIDLPPIVSNSDSTNTRATAGGSLSLTGKHKSLQIPEKIRTSSSSWCFDIASPYQGRVTSCFTHSYGKFIRGTGSILYTGGPIMGDNNNECAASQPGSKNDYLPSGDRYQLKDPEERAYDGSWSNNLDWDQHVRYFSGTEIARLMGFPVAEPPPAASIAPNACASVRDQIDVSSSSSSGRTSAIVVGSNEKKGLLLRTFSFPSDCTMKQQWKMLGNSLNVRVAASVAEIGIRSVLNDFYLQRGTN